jgi:hypothetical protein
MVVVLAPGALLDRSIGISGAPSPLRMARAMVKRIVPGL